jgi:orotidine-5'-phosphate decarboxylase
MFNIFFLLLLTIYSISLHASTIYQKVDNRILKSNSMVCVGLDPDLSKMPSALSQKYTNAEELTFEFLKRVIDITASHACSFKLQKAFYDYLDHGHTVLRDTVAYIKQNYPDIPVFIDCKIGDTDNTMKTYMTLLFDDIKADAVVINPYMGDDVLEPFMQDARKAAIVITQTSNPNAKVVQELELKNGKKLWQEMLDLTLDRWNVNNNLIVVVSSNSKSSNLSEIRARIPQEVPILLAGIGLQGGDPKILKGLLNENGRGVFVNSSRGILYPYEKENTEWEKAILNAVIELKDGLNSFKSKN